MSQRKRYALVGTGGRCSMFIDALYKSYSEHCELVGLCDLSPTRMQFWNRHIVEEHGGKSLPMYAPAEFEKMLADTRADSVIVCTTDCFHHEYIVRAMRAGCDAITEKPMTIDAVKAKAIFDAIKETGKDLRVTFNYRYAPEFTKVKELIMNGTIGRPLFVDFHWVLDTGHGADYFRRWHREKDKSGGLLVHKATHHFDLVNWWLDSSPQTVYCMGELKFYGKKNAAGRGERYDYDRYAAAQDIAADPFALDMSSRDRMKALYLDAEQDSGYIRDRNVFGDDFDIEDTLSLSARYRSGVMLNYSLVAYCPWEGLRVSITGEKGRVELFDRHGSHIIEGQSNEELAATQAKGHKQEIMVYPMFQNPYEVEIEKAEGGHGGGDPILLEQVFSPDPPADPYHRAAGHVQGAASILMGIAGNESIRTGQPVMVDELLKLPPHDAQPIAGT